MVKADLHNHIRTGKYTLDGDFDRTIDFARKNLGKNAIVGIINRNDNRYENLISQKGYFRELSDLDGSSVYIPEKEVYLIKGQEVRTKKGNILVLGLPPNDSVLNGTSLERAISSAKEKGGIVIANSPFYQNGIGNYLIKKREVLKCIDAIETHNSKAEFSLPIGPFPENANETAKDFYKYVCDIYAPLGAISSSDGNSFYEIGSSYTEFQNPNRKKFKSWLKEEIKGSNLETERKNSSSKIGMLEHIAKSLVLMTFDSKTSLF